jgi:hypothetical protein
VPALHRCFATIQTMFDLYSKLLHVRSSATATATATATSPSESEMGEETVAPQETNSDLDTQAMGGGGGVEVDEEKEFSAGGVSLGDIYSTVSSCEQLGVEFTTAASVTPVVITTFAEFAELVRPVDLVLDKSQVTEHIETMESRLDTLLDIGEGVLEGASADEMRQSWEVAVSTLCHFLADLALLLRTGGLVELVREFESVEGRIQLREESDDDGDEDDDEDDEEEDDDDEDDDDEDEDDDSDADADSCEDDIDVEDLQLKLDLNLTEDNGVDSAPPVLSGDEKENSRNLYDFSIDMAKETELLESAATATGLGNTAETLLMDRYLFNAKALLMLRCASCDETRSLFVTKSKVKKKPRRLNHVTLYPENRQRLLSQLMKGFDDSAAAHFLKTWNTFSTGGSPKSFIRLLVESFLQYLAQKRPAAEVDSARADLQLGVCSGDALKYIKVAFSLLLDVERRFSAHLEFLRQYPKMYTACCNYEHCFLCKIEGHHEEQTCEEVQRGEMGASCQYCPGCNVPTLRSEGCNQILCVCGKNWEWEGDDEDSDGSSSDEYDEEEEDSDDGSDSSSGSSGGGDGSSVHSDGEMLSDGSDY